MTKRKSKYTFLRFQEEENPGMVSPEPETGAYSLPTTMATMKTNMRCLFVLFVPHQKPLFILLNRVGGGLQLISRFGSSPIRISNANEIKRTKDHKRRT